MPRLAKRMSELGLGSRAEADAWIERGWVRVDGKVVSRLGARVRPEQTITLDPRARTESAHRVTLMVHKPAGPVAGVSSDVGPPVLALIEPSTRWPDEPGDRAFDPSHRQFLSGLGAIDADASGLLLMTQDGRLAQRLRDPATPCEVLVTLARGPTATPVSPAILALLRRGLALDGAALAAAEVDEVQPGCLRFVLTEHRPRQVRRMCELVGLSITSHRLLRLGQFRLGDLPEGRWRYLSDEELR